jgi:hypothetical protein
MGAHPSSPVKVTDLLLNMVDRAGKQDQAFLIDLAALQVHPPPPPSLLDALPWVPLGCCHLCRWSYTVMLLACWVHATPHCLHPHMHHWG